MKKTKVKGWAVIGNSVNFWNKDTKSFDEKTITHVFVGKKPKILPCEIKLTKKPK